MPAGAFQLAPARAPAEIAAVAALFRAYADSLPIDLDAHGFGAELAGLPGAYAPPSGELLLARLASDDIVGCVGLRAFAGECCEMKRLYVTPEGRGRGLGGALVDAMLHIAADLGYRRICLDTLPTLTDAIALYRRRGFTPIAPYWDSPFVGTLFFSRPL